MCCSFSVGPISPLHHILLWQPLYKKSKAICRAEREFPNETAFHQKILIHQNPVGLQKFPFRQISTESRAGFHEKPACFAAGSPSGLLGCLGFQDRWLWGSLTILTASESGLSGLQIADGIGCSAVGSLEARSAPAWDRAFRPPAVYPGAWQSWLELIYLLFIDMYPQAQCFNLSLPTIMI